MYLIKDSDELELVQGQGYEIIIREDDHPEAIQKRIEQYHKETEPVIDYLRKQDLLVEIDADGTQESVFDEVRKVIKLSI